MITRPSLTIDGVECFSPELALKSDGYDRAFFEMLFEREPENFWFKSRNRLIQFLVRKYTAKQPRIKFLEIGCGTGYVLSGLASIKKLELVGSEIYLEGLRYAMHRNPGVKFIQMDARQMPYQNEFDAIGAFDVLEHIKEDELVIKNLFDALTDHGTLFIAVPQHQFLWSSLDELAYHQRRYSRRDLHQKLTAAGFSVTFTSSFVFSLFPFMAASRLVRKNKLKSTEEFDMPVLLNKLFYWVTLIDYFFIRIGLKLPFGGSLVCVAIKQPRP